jgi:nicotinamide-nucleotide amidase
MSDRALPSAAALTPRLAALLLQRSLKLVTAESCTGGMIAAACTDWVGSSQWFERGFVTYSNAAKTELLGVPTALLQRAGAVSAEVAAAMAQGALTHACAQVAVAVTGVAGPGGGTATKPVGTVWFGFAGLGACSTEKRLFGGDRASVRTAAVQHALWRLCALLQSPAL